MIDRRSFLALIAAVGSTAAGSAWASGSGSSGNASGSVKGDVGASVAGKAERPPAPPAQLGQPQPFSRQRLVELARARSMTDYVAPQKIPQPWIDLTYDQYRGIGFRPESGLWKDTERPINVEFFAPGLYFPTPISIAIVDGDEARPVLFTKEVFNFAHLVPDLPVDDTLGYAGFRVRTTINDPVRKDEFLVFQGASYFRAVGQGQRQAGEQGAKRLLEGVGADVERGRDRGAAGVNRKAAIGLVAVDKAAVRTVQGFIDASANGRQDVETIFV